MRTLIGLISVICLNCPALACLSSLRAAIPDFFQSTALFAESMLRPSGQTQRLYGFELPTFNYCNSTQFRDLTGGRRDLCNLTLSVIFQGRGNLNRLQNDLSTEAAMASMYSDGQSLARLMSQVDRGLRLRRHSPMPQGYFTDRSQNLELSMDQNLALLNQYLRQSEQSRDTATRVRTNLEILKSSIGMFSIWWRSLLGESARGRPDDQRFIEPIVEITRAHLDFFSLAPGYCHN